MPRLHPAEGGEMSVLWAADQGDFGGEEAVPVVWGAGIQDGAAGGGSAWAEEGAKDHGLRGLREAGVAAAL